MCSEFKLKLNYHRKYYQACINWMLCKGMKSVPAAFWE